MLDTNTAPRTGTETVIENTPVIERTPKDSRPVWMREEGAYTLQTSYTLAGETIHGLYSRVAQAAGERTAQATGRATTHWRGAEVTWAAAYFDAMWSGWLCPASPILSNLGTTRGLPISCNSIHVGDSVHGIFSKSHEAAMLAKNGAGLGIYVGDIRGRGKAITNNGTSKGVIPWLKVYESTIGSVSQGSTRRGSAAFYLPLEHLDAEEFLDIRRPTGDPSLRTPHMHHGVTVGDIWMQEMVAGDTAKRALWTHTLRTRIETGEPYLMFRDSVNSRNPVGYKNAGLEVKTSNLCCLSGDTLVLTRQGPEPISALVGRTVEIWDGQNWVENSSFELKGEDVLYRIHLSNGTYVDSNDRHRWFAAESYADIAKRKYRERTTTQLTVGSWLEAHNAQAHGTEQCKGAYLKGFLCGDGTHIDDRPMLHIHQPKYGCMDALLASGAELPIERVNTNALITLGFGDEHQYDSPETFGRTVVRNMTGLSVRKGALLPWVTEYREALPESIYAWDRESKVKWLSGLIDADGTVSGGMIQISSVNEQFIRDLAVLIRTLGYSLNIDKGHTRVDMWRVSISVADSYELISEGYTQRVIAKKKPNRRNTGWRRIVRIERLDGTHPVYCPSVPTTGKFALANGLMTGNSEITLYTDEQHTFVCCLSSLNLFLFDEWKDTTLPALTVRFLDAVLDEYIDKASRVPGLDASVRSAIAGRALGIGVLGWHSLLQSRQTAFDSSEAMRLNRQVFSTIRKGAEAESRALAVEFGEPAWCQGQGMRHSHLMAVAPTTSNSLISGGYSQGIEPLAGPEYAQAVAQGTIFRANVVLEQHIERTKADPVGAWQAIRENGNSLAGLDSIFSREEQVVFASSFEVNQGAIVRQAAQRQTWVDQAQSVNLFIRPGAPANKINELHLLAWRLGLKTLYYVRSKAVLQADKLRRVTGTEASAPASDPLGPCLACEG